MNENETIEYKKNYTDNIYKEIVAFLNTNSGTIYIGYDDNGKLIGLDNPKEIEEKISNGIKTNISPDARVFISINAESFENKEYIIEEYPEFILKEIVLNSIIHRDYTTLTSNILNIYKDSSIELISYGSLYGNITIEDILAGLSTTRNPYLQSLLMRLKRVEALESGIRRVYSYYKNKGLNLEIKALPSTFIVELPRITLNNVDTLENDVELIINHLRKNDYITRKEAEKILNKEKTTTANLLNKMVEDKLLRKVGNGPATKYELFK